MSRIGGVLDMAAYAALAQQHRPAEPAQLQAEVLRLHCSGHSAVWIAESLHIDQRQVDQWLQEAP